MHKLRYHIALALAMACLTGCTADPTPTAPETTRPSITEPQITEAPTTQPEVTQPPATEPAPVITGWLQVGNKTYYYGEDGKPHTGWLELPEGRYYFRSDGTMATGKVAISDTETRYFATSGKEVILVNPWNTVPADYAPDIVGYGNWQVDASCLDALEQMIADCAEAGHTAVVVSAYRSHEYQAGLFQNRIQRFMDEGYDREEAERLAAMRVARPGTSEHELGLALDIVDVNYQNLNEKQETMPAQIWLMENSWRYGFILRYPNGTTDVTGIIYEPWHYRYVGKELAKELHDSGLCLEEYLNALS